MRPLVPIPANIGLDPAMGVLLADVHGPGQLVPVAPLEAVDQVRAGMPMERSSRAKRAGEVLAMAFLPVDQEVLYRVETAIDDVHLQSVAELPGIAEVAPPGPGPSR